RLVADEDPRSGVEPFAQDHLLLVPARERPGRGLHRSSPDAQAFLEAPGRLVLGGSPDEAEPAQVATKRRQRDVCRDRKREDEAELAAVLARVGDSDAEGVLRAPDRHLATVEQHLASVRGSAAEEREADDGAPRSAEDVDAAAFAGA